MTVSDTRTTDARRPRAGRLAVAVAIVFGLLYAYDLWEAVNNAIEVPRQFAAIAELGIPVGEVPWTLIVVNIAIPPVVYLAAVVLGRRRSVFGRAVFFAAGLALVAVLTLDIVALA